MKTSTPLLLVALFLSACGDYAPVSPSADRALAPDETHEPSAPPLAPRRFAVPIDGLPALGDRNALVTIVEFIDYECPYSTRADKIIDGLRAELGRDLRVVVAEHPLAMHPNARESALAALAAEEQGRFEAVHRRLFERSDAHSNEGLIRLGAELRLGSAFERDRSGESAHAALAKATALAAALRVTGTPTFFVNGRKISGAQPVAVFEGVIREELRHARQWVAAGVAPSDVYAKILEEARTRPARPEDDIEREPATFVAAAKTAGGAHLLGRPDAPKTVVLFADFECPYSARLDARLRDLVERNPGLRVVLRNRPLGMHPHSRLAAKAALAADAQGQLAAYVRRLFEAPTGLERDALLAYATAVGLDPVQFERDLDSAETERRLKEDETLAEELEVRGTPTSFVDGYRVSGAQTEAVFSAALSRAP